ncbi:hypothetical protein [Nitrospirillum sp. BR 11828]|uniref:hypothetical protein n=1 Tax=Nitrospirillum sp. BR 11828 TaxID=3104325 RepID=UPI002AC9FDA8|nr:hypothetical protein [Nitrospirillum sp. BR 11828]MDZ5646555.1 hypothetical protein [Nitrospirillum sp. BR 11828]
MDSAKDLKDREHIAKLVRLMGSEHEGEATTALRKLQGALRQRGLNFNDLGYWITQPAPTATRTGPADHTACNRRANDLTRQNQQLTLSLREAQAQLTAARAAAQKAEARVVQLTTEGEAARRQGRRHWWAHGAAGALVCALAVLMTVHSATVPPPRPVATGPGGHPVATDDPRPAVPAKPRVPAKPMTAPTDAVLRRDREIAERTAYLYGSPGREETIDTLLTPHTPVEVLAGDVVPGWLRVHVETEDGDKVGYVQAGRIGPRAAGAP